MTAILPDADGSNGWLVEGTLRTVTPVAHMLGGKGHDASSSLSRDVVGWDHTEPAMTSPSEIRKVAFVGDYLPRKCGIATFTHDMRASVAGRFPEAECFVVPVNDRPEGYDYPPEVRFEIDEPDLESYRRAADYLNFANTDVVCLQHEYGIYGGAAGGHVLGLVRDLRMPVVTTFHTVLKEPDGDQRRVLTELAGLSARVVVMTEKAGAFLRDIYAVPAPKIDVIAHGIPDVPFVDPAPYKEQFGVGGRPVALTFGLLSPNKGIEHVLRAVPGILPAFPDFVYLVLGATHPDLVRDQGERYRSGLERLARDLGIGRHVIFYNRFVELEELTEFIRAADVYVTPYLNPAQITSGTLAYSFGCGKAIVSTPYWHAEELLAAGRGVIVPFADPGALAREITGLLRDEPRRAAMSGQAYRLGREMIWGRSAERLHGRVPAHPARPPGPAALAADGADPGRAAGRPARLAARPPHPDDRRDGDAPARHVHRPQLRRGVLHRRQRPCPPPDRLPRRAGAGPGRRSIGSPGGMPRSSRRRSTRRRAGSATSWGSIGGGWKRSGRRIPTAGHSGRSARASAGPAAATSPTGRPPTSSGRCRPSWERPHPGPGRSGCSASASTSGGSAATGSRPRPATP